MARKNSTSVHASGIKEVISDIKVESTIAQPIEENDKPIVAVPVINEFKKPSLFTKEEKEYILKTISLGYHYKDVIKKAKVYLNLSEDKYEVLSNNVKRVEDIFTNLGIE